MRWHMHARIWRHTNPACIHRSGEDREGRAVFVLVASRYLARETDGEKALLHLISTMDASVHKPYVVVWVHSNFSVALNQPLPVLLNSVYETLDRRFKKNLAWLYVVHPSMSSKALLMALRAVPCPHLPRPASISLLLIQTSIYCRVHPVLSPPIYRCCRPNSFARSSPATASRTFMPTAIPSRSFCQTLSRSTRLRWGPRCSTKCLASTVSFPGNTDKASGRPKTLLPPKGVLYTRATRRVPTPPRGSGQSCVQG